MLHPRSLQSIYLDQVEKTSSSLDLGLLQFLKSRTLSQDILEEFQWGESLLSEEKAIENWKRLLAVNMMCSFEGVYESELAAKVRQFERHPWNQSSQYFRCIVALNHALAKMPVPEVGPSLLESGAALIDLHEYCPWLALPYTPQHFEFGVFLSLLSLHANRDDLKEIVLAIANWQFNTLDSDAKPLPGLFVRENRCPVLQHLTLCYLLFRCASLFSDAPLFAAIAQESIKGIWAYVQIEKEKIDPLWVLVEYWLEQHGRGSDSSLSKESFGVSKSIALSEQIYDSSTALAGYRSSAQHAVCTLHGEGTGLGDIRYGDVQIITYGPQYLPLSDCSGFGIEGNALSDQGARRSMIEWRRSSFILKGCTRMIDQPASSLFETAKFRGIWLEVVQEFKKPHFYLNTTFLGIDGWDSVAFSFFIKAAVCKVQNNSQSDPQCKAPGISLLPRSLEHYEGNAEAILLEGKENQIEIRPLSFKGTMHVIPLAGEKHFWGADFLISYILSPDQRHYQWHVGPPIKKANFDTLV